MDLETIVTSREQEKVKLDAALDVFVSEMRARLHQKVDEGYTGWDTWAGWEVVPPSARLVDTAREAEVTTDKDKRMRRLVDAANFAFFGWNLAK